MNKISDKSIKYVAYAVGGILIIALFLLPSFLLMTGFNMVNELFAIRQITFWESFGIILVLGVISQFFRRSK